MPARVSLTLAGHTHGGQIRIPLVWEHLVPSHYGARYAYGHIVETGRHMIVSGGLGTSIAELIVAGVAAAKSPNLAIGSLVGSIVAKRVDASPLLEPQLTEQKDRVRIFSNPYDALAKLLLISGWPQFWSYSL